MNLDTAFFEQLVDGLRRGENSATTYVFQHFAQRLIGLARKQLDARTRQKVDPEDVVQSVFRSFFRRHADGEIVIGSWDNLWTMLVIVTVRKCANRVRYFHAACRDVNQEEPSTGTQVDVAGAEPSPEEAALLKETLERLMSGMDAREREMLTLSLQGYTPAEIGDQVDRSESTVRLVLKRVKQRLLRWQATDADDANVPGGVTR